MKSWQKALLGVVVVTLLGGVLWYTQIRESSKLSSTEEVLTVPPTESVQEVSPMEETQPVEPEGERAAPETAPSGVSTTPSTKPTPEDCEQDCERFAPGDTQAYCQAFCGLNQDKYQSQDCASLASSEQDFCWKEKAIRERNGETCARIGEQSLRKTCEARIAEEFFDE